MVADKGLSENVMTEIQTALEHHELIKVKLRTDRESRQALIKRISESLEAEKIHVIGQVACFYKRNRKKPVIEFPA
jgi:RNA-binding protein